MMKATQLRQAILQAAVQGKLVPQNPHDEPASILLERIKAEKAKLIKEGKLKKEKPLSPIGKDEIPYEIPENWEWCRLGELTSIYGGKRIPKGMSFAEQPTKHIYIRVTDMKNGSISDSSLKYIDDKVYKLISKYTISSKDAYVTIAGTIGKCGIVPEKFDGMNLTENAAKLCDIKIDKNFLVFALSSDAIQNQFIALTNQMAQPKLALIRISSSLFPLPPLPEQYRIVDKLNGLMAMCDDLEAAEKELDVLEKDFAENLPKSILQAAVQGKLVPQNIHDEPASALLERIRTEKAKLIKEGKLKKEKPLPPITEDEIPFDIPENWAWSRLSDIGEIVGGATPDTGQSKFYTTRGNGIPWLTPADMKNSKNDTISIGDKDITQAGYDSCSTRLIPAESIVFSSRAPIGFIAFAGTQLCTNQGFKSIVPYNTLTRQWIFYYLKYHTDSIIARASGTTFKEVSGEFMRKEIIPIPPLAEQQRITAKVQELLSLCTELKKVEETVATLLEPAKIIKLSGQHADEPLQMAARGSTSKKSEKHQKAIDDMFSDD